MFYHSVEIVQLLYAFQFLQFAVSFFNCSFCDEQEIYLDLETAAFLTYFLHIIHSSQTLQRNYSSHLYLPSAFDQLIYFFFNAWSCILSEQSRPNFFSSATNLSQNSSTVSSSDNEISFFFQRQLQSSWLLLVTIRQIYEFRILFHAKKDIPDMLNLWCQINDI